MFKNNRTNFAALIENLKEKARLTKNEKQIDNNTAYDLIEVESKDPENHIDTHGKRKHKKPK